MLHSDADTLEDIIGDTTIVIPSKNEDPKYVEIIKERAKCPVIVIKDKLYGEAIKEGVRQASTRYILTMDADGQHTYQEAERLANMFDVMGPDMLIGERRQKGRNFIRAFASLVLNCCASVFSGRWVVDLNSGMRIFRRDLAISYEEILCDNFSYTTSIAMSFLADGHNVEWSPILVNDRKEGKSHVKPVKDGLRTLYYIIRIGFALRTRGLRKLLRWR